jgi:hypothetical protein
VANVDIAARIHPYAIDLMQQGTEDAFLRIFLRSSPIITPTTVVYDHRATVVRAFEETLRETQNAWKAAEVLRDVSRRPAEVHIMQKRSVVSYHDDKPILGYPEEYIRLIDTQIQKPTAALTRVPDLMYERGTPMFTGKYSSSTSVTDDVCRAAVLSERGAFLYLLGKDVVRIARTDLSQDWQVVADEFVSDGTLPDVRDFGLDVL